MIATGLSHKTTAERLGIHPTTISKWQRCPHFRAEINRLLSDARDSTARRLVYASSIALSTLIEICTKPDASDRDRISAATSILNLVSPKVAEPGPSDPEEIEKRDQEERLWSGLVKDLI